MSALDKKKAQIIPLFACDDAGGFGFKNKLPWPPLKNDIDHFWSIINYKSRINKKVIVMGRKTWESLPNSRKPIPDVLCIIISTTLVLYESNVMVMRCLEDVFAYIDKLDSYTNNYLIGGAKLIEDLLLNHKDRYNISIITRVKGVFPSDTKIDVVIIDKMNTVYIAPYYDNGIEYAIYHYIK